MRMFVPMDDKRITAGMILFMVSLGIGTTCSSMARMRRKGSGLLPFWILIGFIRAALTNVFGGPMTPIMLWGGMLLTVVCTEAKRDEMVRLIFKHTTTIGVRENISRRFTLKRRMYEKESEFGPVRVKHSEGYGVVREKFEYEDLAAIARARDLSIEDVVKLLS